MKLSENSWHAMVYKMTFTESCLPDNLCPYFWRVFASVIVFVLVGWFFVPAYIFQVIHDKIVKSEWDKLEWSVDGFFSVFAGISFAVNLAVYAIVSTILVWKDFSNDAWLTGFIIFCFAIIAVTSGLIYDKRQSIVAKRPRKLNQVHEYKEPKPNILIEFIKAKYKRYCPKIEWKSKANP